MTTVAPRSHDWTMLCYAEAEVWLLTNWTIKHNQAAAKEGWGIYDCSGSENAPWEICKIDSPDEGEGELEEDADAWRLVLTGTGEHHQLAREFVTIFVPNTEGKFMYDFERKMK